MSKRKCPSCWQDTDGKQCETCGHVFVDWKRLKEGKGAMGTRSGWEVLEALVAKNTSGLHVRGINHETTDPLSHTFAWEINEYGLRDDRFDFSHTKFGPGAEARLELLKKRSLKRNPFDAKAYEAEGARNRAKPKLAYQLKSGEWVEYEEASVELALEKAKGKTRPWVVSAGGREIARGNFGPDVARNGFMAPLTYGVVPPYEEFFTHVSMMVNVNREPVYQMELAGEDFDCGQEAAQGIPNIVVDRSPRYAKKLRITIADVASLWAFINALIHHADDAFEDTMNKEGEAYMSLASGIMTTLGYEWI